MTVNETGLSELLCIFGEGKGSYFQTVVIRVHGTLMWLCALADVATSLLDIIRSDKKDEYKKLNENLEKKSSHIKNKIMKILKLLMYYV